MYEDEKLEQKRVTVVDAPGTHSETYTQRTETVPQESGISATTVAIIVIAAVMVVGAIFYFVSSKNANEAANRNANLAAANQTNTAQPPTTIVQQPAAAAPVIIQQPAAAPVQQAPIIIQQPAQQAAQPARDSSSEDANMQEVAAKRLTEEPDMASVSINVSGAQAVLTGRVNSNATKARAERLVRAVRGMKSVDNRLVVLGG
jgi:hypothetical protein